jgi:hypothetical protein
MKSRMKRRRARSGKLRRMKWGLERNARWRWRHTIRMITRGRGRRRRAGNRTKGRKRLVSSSQRSKVRGKITSVSRDTDNTRVACPRRIKRGHLRSARGNRRKRSNGSKPRSERRLSRRGGKMGIGSTLR